jgi:predicted small lipoprotein YifL
MRRPLRLTWCTALVLASLAGMLTGCGGGDTGPTSSPPSDKVLVQRTVLSWYSALAHGDGEAVCSLMTVAGRKRDLSDGSSPKLQADGTLSKRATTCPAMASALAKRLASGGLAPDLSDASVQSVHVLADQATAVASFGQRQQSLVLRRAGTRWLIDGVQD